MLKKDLKFHLTTCCFWTDGKKVQVGKPALSGTSVEAKVVSHLKDDKVIVFKKKRRKGYKVKNGHRQPITEIIIKI